MIFFDLKDQEPFARQFIDRNGFRRLPWLATSRNWKCLCFLAAPALVSAMLAGGLPVRTHPLYSDRYLLPIERVNEVTLRDLILDDRFIYLSTVIFVVSGTTQTSPADWVNAANTVEGLGGGGSGSGTWTDNVSADKAYGAGGGEYRKIANFSVATPGTTAFNYVIGAGGSPGGVGSDVSGAQNGTDGTQTTFNTTSLVAKPGLKGGPAAGAGGTGGTGAAGNANGGAGGGVGHRGSASGAGGAGGPAGVGGAGTASSATNQGTAGGTGNNGSGGPGGAGNSSGNGTAGSAGTNWDATHGSGGGGGGGRNSSGSANGGAGGLYGAGGGGALDTASGATGGVGKQGLLILTYTPVAAGQPTSKRFAGVPGMGGGSNPSIFGPRRF